MEYTLRKDRVIIFFISTKEALRRAFVLVTLGSNLYYLKVVKFKLHKVNGYS